VSRNPMPEPAPRRTGFTLIEMMVVIAIIGTLALLVGPNIMGRFGDANRTAARTQVELLTVALENFRMDTGRYPTTEEGLAVLRTWSLPSPRPVGWRGPYLRKPVPADPWHRAYLYRAPGEHNPGSYDLYTLGQDGEQGGEGEAADVTSWGEELKK
jgi:general secretion pathway protein G